MLVDQVNWSIKMIKWVDALHRGHRYRRCRERAVQLYPSIRWEERNEWSDFCCCVNISINQYTQYWWIYLYLTIVQHWSQHIFTTWATNCWFVDVLQVCATTACIILMPVSQGFMSSLRNRSQMDTILNAFTIGMYNNYESPVFL